MPVTDILLWVIEPSFTEPLSVWNEPVPSIVPLLVSFPFTLPVFASVTSLFTVTIPCTISAVFSELPVRTSVPAPSMLPLFIRAADIVPSFVNSTSSFTVTVLWVMVFDVQLWEPTRLSVLVRTISPVPVMEP